MPLARVPRLLDIEETGTLSLPERSRLFILPPVGIGTPMAEGLSSYICRLAAAHHLTPFNLMRFVLSNYGGDDNSNFVIENRIKEGHLVNAFGSVTHSWLEMLAALTSRSDLKGCTLARYEGFMAYRGLKREHRAWCPDCLAEWKQQGKPIYEPLLWIFLPVTICPLHNVVLEDRCKACGAARFNFLGWRTVPGYCLNCSAWLGRSDTISSSRQSPTDYEQWAAKSLGQLVAAAAAGPVNPKLTQQAMIKLGSERLGDGTLKGFGKLIGRAKNTVWTWANTDTTMSLPDILNLCYVFEIDLLDFLNGRPECWENITGKTKEGISSAKRASTTRLDLPRIEQYLRAQNLNAADISSIAAITRELGLPERTLRRHFPDLCREISRKHRGQVSDQSQRKKDQVETEVRRVMVTLINNGEAPTRRKVASVLGDEYLFLKQTNNEIWHRLYREIVEGKASA